MDRNLKWFEMPIGKQLANVGGEVNRAIKWKNKNDREKEFSFFNKAMDFLSLTMDDPKNKNRIPELTECRLELLDFFYGGNIYSNTDQNIMKYFDDFLY